MLAMGFGMAGGVRSGDAGFALVRSAMVRCGVPVVAQLRFDSGDWQWGDV